MGEMARYTVDHPTRSLRFKGAEDAHYRSTNAHRSYILYLVFDIVEQQRLIDDRCDSWSKGLAE